jgi:hypothetical protein
MNRERTVNFNMEISQDSSRYAQGPFTVRSRVSVKKYGTFLHVHVPGMELPLQVTTIDQN